MTTLKLFNFGLVVDFFKKSQFSKNVIETFGTQIFLMAIGLLSTVITARALAPEGRGLYAIALSVGAIGIQFGNLGLFASNIYFVSKKRQLLNLMISNSLFAGFVIVGVITFLIGVLFTFKPGLAPMSGNLLYLSLVWIPIGTTYLLLQNLLLGINDVRGYNKIEVISKAFNLSLLGLIIWLRLVSADYVYLAGLLSLIIALLFSYARLNTLRLVPNRPSFVLLKEHLSYGTRAYLSTLFSYVLLRIDILMIKYWLGAEQAGYYSIAVNMIDLIYILPVITGSLLFPILSSQSTDARKWLLAKKVILVMIPIIITFSLLAFLLAKFVIMIFFGPAYLPATPAFIWLLPAIFFLSINTILMNYFASMGMPPITIYSPLLSSITNILLNAWLLPIHGIVGASISSSISYGFMLSISIIYIQKKLKEKHG